MNSILSIAVSGLSAATTRLNASAHNVANWRSDGPLPDADPAILAAYPAASTPLRVDQVDISGGGTMANVSAKSPAHSRAYDPSAPYANADGMVAAPNVDLADEAVSQLEARIAFAANLAVIRAWRSMSKALLDATA